MKMEDRFC